MSTTAAPRRCVPSPGGGSARSRLAQAGGIPILTTRSIHVGSAEPGTSSHRQSDGGSPQKNLLSLNGEILRWTSESDGEGIQQWRTCLSAVGTGNRVTWPHSAQCLWRSLGRDDESYSQRPPRNIPSGLFLWASQRIGSRSPKPAGCGFDSCRPCQTPSYGRGCGIT
jgi:hypothetical protein